MKVEQVFIYQNIRYLVPLFWCSLLKVGSPNCLLFCQAIISNILRVRTSFNKLFHYLFNVIHQFLFVVLIYNFLLFIKCSNFLKHLLISNNSIKRYFSNLIIVYYLKILYVSLYATRFSEGVFPIDLVYSPAKFSFTAEVLVNRHKDY